MFGNKDKKTNDNAELNAENELMSKVNQDMVVRNMPSVSRFNGSQINSSTSANRTDSNNLSVTSEPKHNFKMVGLLIIVGGFILIAALVYVSYIYIIKPQVKTTPVNQSIKQTEVAPVQTIAPDISSTTEISMASSTDVATITPNILDTASSSASSTLNDDMVRKTVSNLTPLIDTDNDGLNDEEEAVLGTNPNAVDTNSNTYNDLAELNNGYDPAGKGKINTNVNLSKYTNKTIGYEMLYPKNWEIKSVNNDATITFTAPDNSIFQVSVQDNSDHQTILGWYGSAFPDVTPTYDKLKSNDNWEGIYGEDGLNFYLTDKKRDNIYVVSYIPAVDGRLAYPNIFKLMINSLLIK